MGDYFNVEFNIGGRCTEQTLNDLVEEATKLDFFVGWDDDLQKDEFLSRIRAMVAGDPECPIQLTGYQARHTDILQLTAWCRDNGLFYQVNIAAMGEYPAERYLWLPGMTRELEWSEMDPDGHDVQVSLDRLKHFQNDDHDLAYVIQFLEQFDQEAPKFELVQPQPVVLKDRVDTHM